MDGIKIAEILVKIFADQLGIKLSNVVIERKKREAC